MFLISKRLSEATSALRVESLPAASASGAESDSRLFALNMLSIFIGASPLTTLRRLSEYSSHLTIIFSSESIRMALSIAFLLVSAFGYPGIRVRIGVSP